MGVYGILLDTNRALHTALQTPVYTIFHIIKFYNTKQFLSEILSKYTSFTSHLILPNAF